MKPAWVDWIADGEKKGTVSGNWYMREVFIISTGKIVNGKTAGARRILNIARSIAEGEATVYLCSLSTVTGKQLYKREIHPGVISVECNDSGAGRARLKHFLRGVNSLMTKDRSSAVVYLYPSTFILKDFIYLLYFKFIKGYRFYCEINEMRTAIAFSSAPPEGWLPGLIYLLKSVKDYVVYKLSEFQVILYDGIVVISQNLENYFRKYTRQITRVPILCDVSGIIHENVPGNYDGKVFRICFAGYIKMEKEGFDILLKAIYNLGNESMVELYLYGILEDQDNRRLMELSAGYGLTGKIHYMGNIEPERLMGEFLKYHLLILPRPLNRRTKYGFSTKLSEYLVSGVPVLLTDVSDNALYIKDNYNGYLINPGSSQVMAEKLNAIIREYNNQARSIVANAYKTAREELDYRLYSERYIDFLFRRSKSTRRVD